MSVIKCRVTRPYVERSLCGDFIWHVYNVNSGHIVASTYSDEMASAILIGIRNSQYYNDEYAIAESWQEPEPMV
jgi:hypothetical protein